MPRSHRTSWLVLALVVVASAALVGGAYWTLDPASLKLRLIEAAQRATGRVLTISGPIGIKLSLTPTITMEQVALANPPGFSGPDLVKVDRVELGLALYPLLRHQFEIDHVTLVRPDLMLETNASGQTNWMFSRPPRKPAGVAPLTEEAPIGDTPSPARVPNRPASDAVAPVTMPAPPRAAPLLKAVRVEDGKIAWTDSAGHRYQAGVERLTLTEPAAPLADIDATIGYDGRIIRVTARTGPLEDLRSAFGAAPWPVAVKLETGRSSIKMDGKIDRPLAGRGYDFTIDADVPDPASLDALLPRLPLGILGEVGGHARITDSGGPMPNVSELRVNLASVNLDDVVHGLGLSDVSLKGDPGAPLTVAARMTLDGVGSTVSGQAGDLNWLLNGRSAPIAVNLRWNAASARASLTGMIQTPRRMADYDLNLALDLPDPAQVFPRAPVGLKSVVLRTKLTDAPGVVPFQLTSGAGDLEGVVAVARLPKWTVTGQVTSGRLDLDTLLGTGAVVAAPAVGGPESSGPPAASSGGAGGPDDVTTGPGSAVPPRPSAPSSGPPVAASPAPRASRTNEALIPDTTLPFNLIRAVDGDVSFALAHVQLNGADVRRISGRVAVNDGHLRLDPFAIAAPDQRMSGMLLADAAAVPPTVRLTIDAPGLALRPLLLALGLPGVANGAAAVEADLSGTGDNPRALAGSLDGWMGVAVENGLLDTRMLNTWLGPLKALRISGPDVTDLRCFAVRADAKAGVVTIEPLAMNTPSLILEGDGSVDLGRETLALKLRPRAKIGATGIALPLRVSGPMRDPSARIDISPGGFGGGKLAGLLLGGKDVMGAAGGGDPCPDALARAREGGAEAPGGGK